MKRFGSNLHRCGLFVLLICSMFSCRKSEPSSAPSAVKQAVGSSTPSVPAGSNAGGSLPSVSPVQLEPIVRPPDRVDDLARRSPAERDDWTSEVVTDQLSKILAALSQHIEADRDPTSNVKWTWVDDDFTCTTLCPQNLTEILARTGLRVCRWDPDPGTVDARSFARGRAGLEQAIESLRGMVASDGERHVKLKLIRIDVGDGETETDVVYEAAGRDARVSRQQTAQWRCHWVNGAESSGPRLRSIHLRSFEQVETISAATPLFGDETRLILGRNSSYGQQMVPSIHHWLRRVTREFLGQFGHHGLAVGDVDGDGRDDLYVCDAGGLPNRLYVQQADGTARDVSAEAGVDILDDSTGALLVDLDNDEDQDLIVIAESTVNIAENLGGARFRWRYQHAADAGLMSLTSADFDADGDLDLFACGYYPSQLGPSNRDLPFPWPYQDANNGGRNVLLRNDGDWSFVDATESVGLDVNNRRFSFAAAWEDFDNDGDVDLYVANDFGRNCLYRNDQGTFVDVAAALQVEDQASGMSVSWGDYNRDGWMDIYVGNMFSAAGNRITHQPRFTAGLSTDTISLLQRMARGNSLFANVQGREFTDETLSDPYVSRSLGVGVAFCRF